MAVGVAYISSWDTLIKVYIWTFEKTPDTLSVENTHLSANIWKLFTEVYKE